MRVCGALLSDVVLAELTSTGGLLILGIGLNMLGVAQIKVGNLLPAILTRRPSPGLGYKKAP